MAASYTCDGCGAGVKKPEIVGHVIKREYCEACATKAKDFLDAEELLRDACHHQFLGARTTLINTISEGGFKLPDVPDGG